MKDLLKRISQWMTKKEELHYSDHKPPMVTVGDIWWVAIGDNMGSEINGKSDKFSRPVIIYKKLSHTFYLVIPTTSGLKDGSWYASFNFKNVDMSACLHQVLEIDYRRLYDKYGKMSNDDFRKVKKSFLELYK